MAGDDHQAARAWYTATGLPLLTWSSLSGGFFTGRFTREVALEHFEDPADRRVVDSYCYEENFKRLDRARQLADAKGLTVPQIAIAYVLSAPMNVYALVGCLRGAEFAALAEGAELQLTRDEVEWLEAGAPAGGS